MRIITQETAEQLSICLITQEYRYIAIDIDYKIVGERFAAGYKKQLQSYYAKNSREGSLDKNRENLLKLQNS
jgi:hypothetical protein